MGHIIELFGIVRNYDKAGRIIEALKGLDLTVSKGEFVVITGASGSGKSTLLHIIGCLDIPDAGEYRLSGRVVSGLDDDSLSGIRGETIGFVFQAFNLIPQMTLLENVELPFQYSKRPVADVRELALKAIGRTGLTERINHRPNELSGGERQRGAIARAIVIEPEIILADEPTGNLDAATADEIMDIFKGLNAGGVTIIMVTHNPALIAGMDNVRILSLYQGRLTDE